MSGAVSDELAAEDARARRRRKERHRKRRKPQIVVPSWRWWHLVAAVGVAAIGGAITIELLRGGGALP